MGRGKQEWNSTGGKPFAAFAPVPKPTFNRRHRHDLAVLSAFDQHTRGK